METLDDVRKALLTVDEEVHYGTAAKHAQKKPWNYTVFSRTTTKPKDNLTGYSDGYLVSVVRENYVPDTTLDEIVSAMSVIPGIKLDRNHDVEYVYDVKPGTSNTVEMMIVYFCKGRKS